jgi:hypothetical protein
MRDDAGRRRLIGGVAAAAVVMVAAFAVPAATFGDESGSPSASASASGSASTPAGSPTTTPPPSGGDATAHQTPATGSFSAGATPGASAGSSAGGTTAMPTSPVVSGGALWRPYFAEDYNTDAPLGSVLSRYPAMAAYDGFTDTSGNGLYAPDRVLSVHDGVLDFDLHEENGQPLVSSVLPDGYDARTAMRVSIRYRTDPVPGYKFVMILWPQSNVWNEGEIDWPEGALDGEVQPFSAIPGSFDAATGTMSFLPTGGETVDGGQNDWHVATTEWTSRAIRFYWDGKLVNTITGAVPKVPMRLTLQAETSTEEGVKPGTASGHLQVDWVVAYRYAGLR